MLEDVVILRLMRGPKLRQHNLSTIDAPDHQPHAITRLSLQAQLASVPLPDKAKRTTQVPGVGSYEIGCPIVRPVYDTYDKGKNVVLVKISHIGGTSSFDDQQPRFSHASIYQQHPTPGPGAYRSLDPLLLSKRKQAAKERGHSERYDTLCQMLREGSDRRASIPNYCIGTMREDQYNGIPKHLQQMYWQLRTNRSSPIEQQSNMSLSLEQLAKLKQTAIFEQPMPTLRHLEVNPGKEQGVGAHQQKGKMTETMQRLQEEARREGQRQGKIRAILQDSCRYSLSTARDRRGLERGSYNKNMVNMLYEVGRNRPRGKY